MQIFDGRAHSLQLDQQIKIFLESHPQRKGEKAPKLGIVVIGNNQASQAYVGLKRKLCATLDIPLQEQIIDESLSDNHIFDQVQEFVEKTDISGLIVQLPLPRKSLEPVLGLIPIEKDLDLLSPESKRRFYAGEFRRIPPTVRAFDYFLDFVGREEFGDKENNFSIGVVGFGELVGRPVAHFATMSGHSVEVIGCYRDQRILDYQVLVLSAGVPNLVNPQNIAPNSSVIDFGFSKVAGKTVGDLDMSKSLNHLGIVSPAVGGMGPLVIRFLIMNFLGI